MIASKKQKFSSSRNPLGSLEFSFLDETHQRSHSRTSTNQYYRCFRILRKPESRFSDKDGSFVTRVQLR